MLHTVAGFVKASSGQVSIHGEKVEKPDIRRMMIFQNYGLLPWRSVQKNVELGLESKKVPKAQRKEIAAHYLDLVGLGHCKEKHPYQLSGGMQQRVAIARALAVEPEVLFMDEPFGALDAITRMRLQDDVRRLSVEEKKTILFVTHDIEEAIILADRVVVMEPDPGRIKSIVKIQLGHERDRTSDEFILARDKIFEIFNMKTDRTVEYYI